MYGGKDTFVFSHLFTAVKWHSLQISLPTEHEIGLQLAPPWNVN